ncbi:MAG TPA: 2-C-methyl-D-erythritol 4-phosphate cytidylyltransferase [Planctomycetaceae bacterium]|nr:2-C-methyl-D-erythritol 4-phosphate cytidylyltransferase [Planctomycetaceae bacterium]
MRRCLADAIVVAAGRGRRFGGGENKVLFALHGKPIWQHAVEALQGSGRIGQIVMVIRPEDRGPVRELAHALNIHLTDGGNERYDSVQAGLAALQQLPLLANPSHRTRLVAVHDAARPLVSATEIGDVVDAAERTGAAVLATPIRGTLKRRDDLGNTTTINRNELWEALTPQVFRFDIIDSAYRRWRGRPVTDDAEMVERSGFPVTLVPGSAENLKITRAEDLTLAHAILSQRNSFTADNS